MDYGVVEPSLRCERLTTNRLHIRVAIFKLIFALIVFKSPFFGAQKAQGFGIQKTDRPTG
jgi:hypothetical protein